MGLIHIELFATLDLVGQAPGGPDEDPVGFPFGGWQAPLMDEVTGAQVGAAYQGTDALLLGRRTYDIFAAYWPHQEGGEDNEIATLFNSVPKYVASRGRPDLSWAGSTQLGPDLAGAVREVRDRHEHVKVVGSLNLVQTLLREKLFDRLDLWVHPIVLGVGKKVFDGGEVPTNVTLLEPPVAGPKGIVVLRYGLAEGTPGTGDMAAPDRGAAATTEAARARWSSGYGPVGGAYRPRQLDPELLVVQAAHGQVDGRPRHPARPVGRHEDRHARRLRQRHEPSGVGAARHHLLELFPGHARRIARASKPSLTRPSPACRAVAGPPHECHGARLGGQLTGERLLRGLRRAVAPDGREARPRVERGGGHDHA